MPDLVRYEILRGMPTEQEAALLDGDLELHTPISIGGRDVSAKAAEHYRTLRRLGVTVRNSIDMLIGTWCIVNGVPLLHNDRDYDGVELHLGLQVWRGHQA